MSRLLISKVCDITGRMARRLQRIQRPGRGWVIRILESTYMNNLLLKLYIKFQNLASREEGQDLVEYALVVALIAFGATAGMSALAKGINTAFTNVSNQLGSDITSIIF
jgi:pilus assembly protein Flp/PilA